MPLYEYSCTKCEHRYEKLQSFNAPEDKVCPVCGEQVIRPLTSSALHFKGAGWYVTDYGTKTNGGSDSD